MNAEVKYSIGHLEFRCSHELSGQWSAAGGELAAQALSPLAALEANQLRGMSLLAMGSGAAIAGLAALQIGFERIDLVLHPDDVEPFKSHDPDALATIHDRLEAVESGRNFMRVMLGCDGLIPPLSTGKELVRRLRHEGQIVLYGLPMVELNATFDTFAKNGLSLRSAGFHQEQAFLAGSLGD